MLNDEQLLGVIAHEMEHQNDHLNLLTKAIRGLSAGTTFWSITLGVRYLLVITFYSAYPFAEGLFYFAVGLLFMYSLAWYSRYILAAKSRATESKTDVKSVMDVGTAKGLQEALAIISEAAKLISAVDKKAFAKKVDPLLKSHPDFFQRLILIKSITIIRRFLGEHCQICKRYADIDIIKRLGIG